MLAAGLAAAVSLCAPRSQAQAGYPRQPIRLVVPRAAGGVVDVVARLWAEAAKQRLGNIVVENQGGGGGLIGAATVAQAKPDGYTLLAGTTSELVITPLITAKPPYDPLKDLAPIAITAESVSALMVPSSLPVRTLAELVAYDKAHPGKLSYGSGGVGAPHHLYAALLGSMADIRMTHVPYKGSLPALNDVVGGHIDLMFCDIPPAIGMIESKRVRALGVSTRSRIAAFPDIPPIGEVGVPGFDVAGWFMVVGPAQMPAPIVARLHDEMAAVLRAPEVKEQIVKLSLVQLEDPSVDDMKAFVKSEIARWSKVVDAAGIAGTE